MPVPQEFFWLWDRHLACPASKLINMTFARGLIEKKLGLWLNHDASIRKGDQFS